MTAHPATTTAAARPRLAPDGPALPTAAGFDDAVDALARAIWHHARADSVRAMEAVACCVRNRRAAAGHTASLPDLVRAEFLPPSGPARSVTSADPLFAVALRIARRALAGQIADPTLGATRLHAAADTPAWAEGLAPLATVGGLVFHA